MDSRATDGAGRNPGPVPGDGTGLLCINVPPRVVQMWGIKPANGCGSIRLFYSINENQGFVVCRDRVSAVHKVRQLQNDRAWLVKSQTKMIVIDLNNQDSGAYSARMAFF